MKKYTPRRLIFLPRWIEVVLHYLIFLIVLFILKKMGIGNLSDSANSESGINIVVTLILFIAYKILGTFTAVDLIIIDSQNRSLQFDYWLFYLFKKKLIITFDELNYKKRNDILLIGGSMGIYFYKEKRLKIKLNRRNGWNDHQIDSIIQDLLKIKEPLTPIKRRNWEN